MQEARHIAISCIVYKVSLCVNCTCICANKYYIYKYINNNFILFIHLARMVLSMRFVKKKMPDLVRFWSDAASMDPKLAQFWIITACFQGPSQLTWIASTWEMYVIHRGALQRRRVWERYVHSYTLGMYTHTHWVCTLIMLIFTRYVHSYTMLFTASIVLS